MPLIFAHGTHWDQVYNEQGDLAVVVQQPIKGNGPSVVTNELYRWLLPIVPRLNGIYVVHASYTAVDKQPSMRELRTGWARVQAHIATLGPNVKRVLLMGSTALLRVAVPALNKKQEHGTRPDLQDCHGTIFTLEQFQLVPTWTFTDYALKHVQPWMQRDLARFERLTKPNAPLQYLTYIPNTFAGKTVVVDLETSGVNESTDTITSLGIQWSDTERAIITNKDTFEFIKATVATAAHIVMHNASFDLGFMGEEFRQRTRGKIRDTLIRARARGELVGGLKHLGNLYTSRPGCYSWIKDEAHSFDDPAYVTEDLDSTWRLYKLWQETTPVIEVMERAVTMVSCQTAAGTAIDMKVMDSLVVEVQEQVAELREELTERYNCDPNQVQELCTKLIEMGHILSKKTQTGKNALTAEVLEELGLVDILEYRKAQKLDSAFVGKIQGLCRPDGTIPHHQGLLNARTGRTTMRDFNWQQMPKKGPGKKLAVSRWEGGQIWNCDLKSAEVFVACYLSGDKKLAKALRGPDMHRANAARGFNKATELVTDDERFQAKSLIFRSIFGGGPQNDIQKRVHVYMTSEFSALFEWINIQKKKGQNDLRVVDVLGKVTNMLDKFDYAGKWACGRLGINAPVQGVQSHIAIAITLRVWELFLDNGLQSLVLYGVHDSYIVDCHPAESDQVLACMQQAFHDVGKWVANWLPMIEELSLLGELTRGVNWAACKDTVPIILSTNWKEAST